MLDSSSTEVASESRRIPRIATFGELRGYLSEDYRTHRRKFWAPGFQALAAYRIGVWVKDIRFRPLRGLVRLLHTFLAFFTRNFYGIELPIRTYVGRRVEIAHQHGIVIHPGAVIGDDCLLRHGVTIGGAGEQHHLAPTLGNRVQVGVGVILAGPITIGDGAVIGPNAVVMTNVPAGSIVAAPPARIVAPPPRRADADKP
jgi:serine O-acetyltransferase